ncbi:adenylate/guanylate cyclase domain-containing protein [Pleurocapsa sp. PCC 7319]|uniref:adenylate/guanylate cyclase domain-containing protein n=1 Tax=Pleurocapsa sp. PCC 7319 TaxID=118161 RepID=UPI00034DE05C|nr:adenylate/guanylate cyclase domain-containing protein [Pleurocapsa sp. PCC 7319]
MLILLVVSISSILAIAFIGYGSGQQALNNSIFNQLISLKESKAYQIETYFKNIRAEVQTMSENPSVIETMQGFKQAYQELESTSIQPEWDEKLKTFYAQEFLPKLAENIPENQLQSFELPTENAARYLQYYYIANNANAIGKKYFLDNPLDKSNYSRLHQQIQSIYRNLIVKFGYYDLLLIDTETGNIVYSVEKEVDFATNLYQGAYSKSNLARVVQAVRQKNEPSMVAIADFEAYRPSYAEPAAFIASPIFDGTKLIGVLALQISIDEIDQVMTGDGNWQRHGLGKSGETYLVGSDYGMRGDSRFLVEDKEAYLQAIAAKGITEEDLEQIKKFDTSILYQKVNTPPVKRAFEGETGTDITEDYRGVVTLNAYRPLDIDGLDWAIIAQIDRDEAFAPIMAFQHRVLFSTIAIVFLVTAIAGIFSHYFVRPIYSLIRGFRQVEQGQTDVVVKVKAKDEFRELGNSFNEMVSGLNHQQQLVIQREQENDKLLLSILPESVAQRLKKGEKIIADNFASVTVLFADLHGFNELAKSLSAQETVSFLNSLVTAFDEAAESYGVEKVKTIGSGYMAVSGLSISRIDHAKRVVDFAIEMMWILDRFNRERQTNLKLSVGINSGEVVAGIVGQSKFSYDLWGDTVNIAHYLQVHSSSDSIHVTDNVHASLGDLYDFESVPVLELADKGNLIAWSVVVEKKAINY